MKNLLKKLLLSLLFRKLLILLSYIPRSLCIQYPEIGLSCDTLYYRSFEFRCQARYRPPVEHPSGDVEGRNDHSRRRMINSPLNIGGASDYQNWLSLSNLEAGKLGYYFSCSKLSFFFFTILKIISRGLETIQVKYRELQSWPKSSSQL